MTAHGLSRNVNTTLTKAVVMNTYNCFFFSNGTYAVKSLSREPMHPNSYVL